MAGLGRRRAEPREHEQHRRGEHDGADEQGAPGPRSRERVRADRREDEDGGDGKAVAGGEVAEGPLEVAEHVERRAQPVAAAADADLEAAREHEIGAPERDAEHEDDRDRRGSLAQPRPRERDVDDLRGEHERAVRMRGDAQQRRGDPRSPAEPSAPLRRLEQREE